MRLNTSIPVFPIPKHPRRHVVRRDGRIFSGRLDDVGHVLDPGLLVVIERAASLSAADMAHALQQRNTYYTEMRQFMDLQRFDLLLTPTLPVTASTAGLDKRDGWQRATLAPLNWTPYTFPFNLTGQPAATVPCGFDGDGLPMGLQIVGQLAQQQHGPSCHGRI